MNNSCFQMVGKHFGKLTVIQFVGRNKDYRDMWECQCVCGNKTVTDGKSLRNGNTKSCGCMKRTEAARKNTKHGSSKTRLYHIWTGIKRRCLNPNDPKYKNYGHRGITICREWRENFVGFQEWAISHGYTDSMSIERIDVNKGYEPANCTWIPPSKQALNKTTTKRIEFNGETKSMSEWAKELGLNYGTLKSRIDHGWDPERALTENIHNNHGRNFYGY